MENCQIIWIVFFPYLLWNIASEAEFCCWNISEKAKCQSFVCGQVKSRLREEAEAGRRFLKREEEEQAPGSAVRI